MCHIKSTEKPVIVNSQIVVPLSEQCGWRSIGALLLHQCWGLGQVSNSAGGFFCGVPTDHKKTPQQIQKPQGDSSTMATSGSVVVKKINSY